MKRTALVTGGARGIGAAIARELAARGNEVLTPTRGELDLAQPASVEAWVSRQSGVRVDILVNNAGINVLRALDEISPGDFQQMLQVNVASALRLIQAFGPGMRERKWGRILNLSTIFSLVTKERRGPYSMSKAALNALTRSAAVEYGPEGILVNALCPGYVETALTHQNNSPADLAAILASIPLRRMATPDEVARTAAFLCGEENAYITGQMIVMDGGFTCK